ncbi:YceI-like domain-containing protein [Lutibacter oricola]|uniref:YceI-like domain-containing protein n=1 Tax=Lutibacter oricola TaxID=762486 RepID=A0A1H2ZB22_9FLAO|nr:YceI family protein [Lutibacter oricola]SDX14672.1 YceI-like domain-containing protein [Lutibacter oricola]
MKKLQLIAILLVLTIVSTSCKSESKKIDSTKEKSYIVEAKTTSINWTAYKTTSKTPVKGQFTKLNVLNAKKANNSIDALNGIKFSIPVSSLFTKDSIRDGKLKKFFFGVMDNTELLSGTIHMNNETSGTVDLTMNGISQVLPITYVVSDQMVTIEALMDLDNWKAQPAIESLNKVCEDLHKGDDGISKTWSEVKIDIATYLKYE